MQKLIFNVDREYPLVRELAPEKISIGKAKENDILLPEDSVSAFHAELKKEETGSYCLENLSVFKGTVVNDEIVTSTVSLKDGDKIKIGGVTALYVDTQQNAEEIKALNKLIEREEIERIKVEQHQVEANKLRLEIEESQRTKEQLKKDLEKLSEESKTIKAVLKDNLKESHKLAKVVNEANSFKAAAKELEREFSARTKNFDNLGDKIASREKILKDLDLESARKQKSELKHDIDLLNKDIETSKVELEKNKRAADDASSVFEKAKKIEAGINEQEDKLKARKSEYEKLKSKIADREKALKELDLETAIDQKAKLSRDLDQLAIDIGTSKTELAENRRASSEAAAIFEKSKKVEAEIVEQEKKLKSRKSEFDELGAKIADLDVAIKQKELVTENLEQLNKQLESSQVELEKNKRASEEAVAIFEKAKKIELGIGALEATLRSRNNENEDLAKTISDREKSIEELGAVFDNRSQELESLTNSIENKKQEVGDLAATIETNEGIIKTAEERLSEIEGRVQAGLLSVDQSQTLQQTLKKESFSLSQVVAEKSKLLERLRNKVASGGTADFVCPPVRLIKPEMGSLFHYFNQGAGIPDDGRFDPIGFNALAACARGSLHRDADSIMSVNGPVLLQLSGDMTRDRQLVDSVVADLPDRLILVCWAEGQLSGLVEQKGQEVQQLLSAVSGIISIDSDTSDLLNEVNSPLPFVDLRIPVPIDAQSWNLSTPIADRKRGVMICGDGFDSNSKVHRARVDLINQLADETKTSVSFYGQSSALVSGLNIPSGQISASGCVERYSEYVRLIGQHRFVTGFGKNNFGTDITGDALLARTMFIGGDSENITDQLLFPETCLGVDGFDVAKANSAQFLTDNAAFGESMERSQVMANQMFSFEGVHDRLGEFIHGLSQG